MVRILGSSTALEEKVVKHVFWCFQTTSSLDTTQSPLTPRGKGDNQVCLINLVFSNQCKNKFGGLCIGLDIVQLACHWGFNSRYRNEWHFYFSCYPDIQPVKLLIQTVL